MAFGRLKVDELETSTQVISVDTLGSGVSDGNKGDITVSSGGTVWSVNDGAVALNELSDVTLTSPSDGQSLSYNASTGQWVNSTPAGGGTVTSVGLVAPTGFSVSGSPVTTSGNITLSFAAGYSLPTTASQTNWDTAYTERLYWDGGATGLNAATGRASLGLGGAATLNVGTTTGTVAAGDDSRFVPAGGATGQALIKSSGTDYDAAWQDITTGIDDLTDVTITSVADGEVLTYDSATSQWINATPTGGGGTPGGSDTQIQFNSSGAFAGSADLTWDDTAKELGVGGDINLDDGGTYATTLQLITPTANRTISFPDATGTVALVGGSSGQLIYNAAGAYAGGPLYDSTAGTLGYATGGTITQATSKSTGVTLNGASGRITLNAAALNADTTVSFTLTNSSITANDLLVLNHVSGGTAGAYLLNAQAAAGSASINVRNITAGSLSEAIVIGFAVLKA